MRKALHYIFSASCATTDSKNREFIIIICKLFTNGIQSEDEPVRVGCVLVERIRQVISDNHEYYC